MLREGGSLTSLMIDYSNGIIVDYVFNLIAGVALTRSRAHSEHSGLRGRSGLHWLEPPKLAVTVS
jgi:hypothetical protein